MALEILVVDDEHDIRDLVAGVLTDEGYVCRTAGDSTSALAAIDDRRPSLVLLDVWLHGSEMDGLEVLDAIKAREPGLPVIIFSGHGNIDTAVSAVGRGAMDFIEKPFEAERLLLLVSRATETERLRRENVQLRGGLSGGEEFNGNSSAVNTVRATLKRVANTGSRVLISGPPGSGKEVAARLLHSWSPRCDNAFVVVNSARITAERFEHELFGEEEAGKLIRPGLLESADGGTLYLDEVSDMPLSTQARILRVLTEQSFVRVGGKRQIGVDVRVVSSTSRDLAKEIEAKLFREDLFYRLNVVPVEIPSLSERRDDIPALAEHFFARYAAEQGLAPPEVGEQAMAALQAYDWPGNVRELKNLVERTVIMTPRGNMAKITPNMLPPEISGKNGSAGSGDGSFTHVMGVPLREARESFEREYLSIQIRRFSGNISRTATFIGMERSALHRKLKLLGMTERKVGEEDIS
jgi:two-component system nitrogen regulation response regulator NtrX